MNIDRFLTNHDLALNPFAAEEARHDPVFERLINTAAGHPDFEKILGRIDQPSTSVVFGEKGSGKTAMRLMIARRVADHNDEADKRTLVVAYDDLNPVLDRLTQRRRQDLGFNKASKTDPEKLLSVVRLEDHQDAIIAASVTTLVDALLDSEDADKQNGINLTGSADEAMKKLPRQRRIDLAALTALYDQPRSGAVANRWAKLRPKLKLTWLPAWPLQRIGAIAISLVAAVLFLIALLSEERRTLMQILGGATGAAAVFMWGVCIWRHMSLWNLTRKIRRETPAVERSAVDLRVMLGQIPRKDLVTQTWPLAGEHDTRFQLTNKLLSVLELFGYHSIMVLVDRVDEPTLIQGKADRMKPVVWPMLDNKFLQQERVGLKLLMPIELRHLLHRESPEFFQGARLDKQNLIDRLTWSGATLYDLCSGRLRVCLKDTTADESKEPTLTDLFTPDVTRSMLVDALDQMHQPRDAFKFLYCVLQEHCNTVSDDDASYRIPRLTLETVRRQQSQRVQDLSKGLSPA